MHVDAFIVCSSIYICRIEILLEWDMGHSMWPYVYVVYNMCQRGVVRDACVIYSAYIVRS